MALATKCPHCNTVFRVAHDQLKLRGGIVRCGACNEVFDGNAALLEPPSPASPIPTPLPAFTPLDQKMAALDTRAAEVLSSEPPVMLELDTALDADAAPAHEDAHDLALDLGDAATGAASDTADFTPPPASEPHADAGFALDLEAEADAPSDAVASMDDKPIATPPSPPPFALPAEPAVLPAADAPLDLDLNVESMSDDELEAALQAELAAMEKTLAEVEPVPEYIDNGRREPTLGEPEPATEPHLGADHAAFDRAAFDRAATDAGRSAFGRAEPNAGTDAADLAAPDAEQDAVDLAAPDTRRSDAPRIAAGADAGPRVGTGPAAQAAATPGPADTEAAASAAAPGGFDFVPFEAPAPLAPSGPPVRTAHDDELDEADEEALVQLSSAGMAEAQAARAHAYLHAASADEAPAEDASADEDSDEPGFVKRARRKQKYGKAATIAMSLGSVLLLGALCAQAVTTFRNPLAAAMPALKPALTSACLALGCKIELPTQIDDLTIEQGELQTLSDTTFSFVTLLRNQSATAQAWPSIELVLDDDKDKHVLRRVFAPRDYLSPDVAIDKGFAPHTEQTVKLYFELHDVKASGYHIAVFYP